MEALNPKGPEERREELEEEQFLKEGQPAIMYPNHLARNPSKTETTGKPQPTSREVSTIRPISQDSRVALFAIITILSRNGKTSPSRRPGERRC